MKLLISETTKAACNHFKYNILVCYILGLLSSRKQLTIRYSSYIK